MTSEKVEKEAVPGEVKRTCPRCGGMLGDGDHLLWSASNPPVIVCTGKRSGVTPLSAEQLGYGAKCGKCGLTLKAAEIGDGFCAKCYEKYNAQMDTEEARAQGAP